MVDFQVFSLIKKYLAEKLTTQAIYFNFHQEMKKPCCVIELEEMWANTLVAQGGIKSRIKFKTTCFSPDNLISSQVIQSKNIINLLDGLKLDLSDGANAIVKFSQNHVDTSNKAAPQLISQLFETVIRGV